MLVSLRKAAKIRSKIETELKKLRNELTHPVVKINVFDGDALAQVDAKDEEFKRTYARYKALTVILVELRQKIGNANGHGGINSGLTVLAALNNRLAIAKHLANLEPCPDDTQIEKRVEGQLERIKNADSNAYLREEMEFTFLTHEDIINFEEEAKALRREIESVTEDIETENNRPNTIELYEAEVAILTMEGII